MPIPTERKHWPRWSKIAFFKAADAVRESIPVYFEGDERTTRLDKNFVEVRMTGPDIREPSKGCHILEVQFNLLINAKENANDLYTPDRLIGQFMDAFANEISVFRLGSELVDDGSFVGCYRLISEIDVVQFGIVDKTLRTIQAQIEGTYELTINL